MLHLGDHGMTLDGSFPAPGTEAVGRLSAASSSQIQDEEKMWKQWSLLLSPILDPSHPKQLCKHHQKTNKDRRTSVTGANL